MTHKHEDAYQEVAEKLVDVTEATLDQFDDTIETLEKEAKRYAKEIERYVTDNPVQSLGIAFCAGFFTAVVLRNWLK